IVIESQAKSVGKETTFSEDQGDPARLAATLSRHTEEAAARLRRKGMEARGVTLKIRFEDFGTHTLAAQLDPPTAIDRPIFGAARALLEKALAEKSGGRKVRLLGVYLGGLAPADLQPRLLEEEDRERDVRLTEPMDSLRERFGKGALISGRSMEETERPGSGGKENGRPF
ncbi:MAG: hypothetical protein V3V56_00760, partial [bacterium]